MRELGRRARKLRSRMTDAERPFWSRIRGRQLGVKFRRQALIGHYIADFACLEHRLIVELDGGQHAASDADRTRDAFFAGRGFRVLRFWNPDVLLRTEAVIGTVWRELRCPSPRPFPQRGEGEEAERATPDPPPLSGGGSGRG